MKKIGLLCGVENSFPASVIDYINGSPGRAAGAEMIKIGAVAADDLLDYPVIFDRISHEVPFYRSVLFHAASKGIRVVNSPQATSVADNFNAATAAISAGITIPRTVILPSKERPAGTNPETFRNMIYPVDWDSVFNYIGFPAYIKPNIEGPTLTSYKIYNPAEFFAAYDLTGSNVMLLQEAIDYEDYFRCYIIARKHVRIMNYDPYQPLHLRYNSKELDISPALREKLEKTSIDIAARLGFDFCAIEYAYSHDTLVATELFNVAPTIEKNYFRVDDFDWLVAFTSEYLIELAVGADSMALEPANEKSTDAAAKRRGRPRLHPVK